MEFDKNIFEVFNRKDFTYRKGDEIVKKQYVEGLEKWTLWCKSLGGKVEKFEPPIIQSWQNSSNLAKHFWARLKFTPFRDCASCISMHVFKEGFSIELSFELKNENSSLTKEEYNRLLLDNLENWVKTYNVDEKLFYISDKTNKYTLKDYFSSPDKIHTIANTKDRSIDIWVPFEVEQVLELDTKSEKLIDILKKLSYLYEKVQKCNEVYNSQVMDIAEVLAPISYWLGGATSEQGDVSQKFIDENVFGIDWVKEDIKNVLGNDKLLEDVFNKYDLNSNARKMFELLFELKEGDRIAIKSTFAKGKTSILRIKAIGTVISDVKSGYSYGELGHTIPVHWESPKRVDIKDIGGHWETLSQVTKQEDIDEIFFGVGKVVTNELIETHVYEPYSKEQFLQDAYIGVAKYNTIVSRLEKKKNIILQGAPGVGKSYIAKKIAYSILGKKDESKVQMIQFHQSYSYEDFIMGYRPNEVGGFEIKEGVFYKFCKNAIENPNDKFFFIIDEINRGNLSKIFGELMLLIETDKRGESFAMSTVYSEEKFYIPENLYIIGLMNTADRSLALIDYALRRRFSFIDIEPAFGENFAKYTDGFKNTNLDKVLNIITVLNDDIEKDESLGKGFKIGHSYFCNLVNADDTELKEIIDCEIIPLLEEYWVESNNKVEEYYKEFCGALNNERG